MQFHLHSVRGIAFFRIPRYPARAMPEGGERHRTRLWLAAIVVAGLAIRLPGLDAPLLEGAAGKQTHTAMVARNLYRGRGTWQRPMVDDVGPPGYFVKELPLLPALAALVYGLTGGPHDPIGRLIGIAAWLLATPAVVALVARDRGSREGLLAGAWFVLAPLGIAYSRSFMSDPAMIAASLAALAAAFRWRARPTALRAATAGAWLALALLLKPHAAFWLAPALAVAALGRDAATASERPGAGSLAGLGLCLTIATGIAGAWYAHAARVHEAFPVPGATVPQGWIDPRLWLEPALYGRIAAQLATMVWTPAGIALTVIALWRPRPPFGLAERALLAWGAGAVVQSIALGTRMFDDAARGTEYYQLALVPVACILVARGAARFADAAERQWHGGGAWALGAVIAALALGAASAVRPALATPARYASLLDDCAEVRARTPPDARLLVVADRAGTVLYYCDRRGVVVTPASSLTRATAVTRASAAPETVARALGDATHVYLPFPDIVPRELADALAHDWERIPTRSGTELYARPGTATHPGKVGPGT